MRTSTASCWRSRARKGRPVPPDGQRRGRRPSSAHARSARRRLVVWSTQVAAARRGRRRPSRPMGGPGRGRPPSARRVDRRPTTHVSLEHPRQLVAQQAEAGTWSVRPRPDQRAASSRRELRDRGRLAVDGPDPLDVDAVDLRDLGHEQVDQPVRRAAPPRARRWPARRRARGSRCPPRRRAPRRSGWPPARARPAGRAARRAARSGARRGPYRARAVAGRDAAVSSSREPDDGRPGAADAARSTSLTRPRRRLRRPWAMRCSFSMRAKRTKPSPPGPNPTPGRQRHLALPHEHRAELDASPAPRRARGSAPTRTSSPSAWGCPTRCRARPSTQRVPTALVGGADLLREVRRLVHRDRRGDLDGLERAVVEVALELHERLHDVGVADHERAAPAGHGEALGHRVQLDGALLGPLGLQDGGRVVAVEADVGVGEVVHDDHLPLPAEVDDALHEVEVDARAGRVVGEGDDEHAGLRPADLPRRLEAVEEVAGVVLCTRVGRLRIGTWRRSAPANSGP